MTLDRRGGLVSSLVSELVEGLEYLGAGRVGIPAWRCAVLYQARHDGSVSADGDGPWAHAVGGLIVAGLLTVTTDGDTVLADDVQYSLRAIDAADVNPY